MFCKDVSALLCKDRWQRSTPTPIIHRNSQGVSASDGITTKLQDTIVKSPRRQAWKIYCPQQADIIGAVS